jgi:aryl-phospho-beta-D-glucosidase BglC (GH1 family)
VLKLFKWCRKYGIRVNLDLHTIPGSQNGYNHSGRQGSINWMYGLMGLANAQRSLDYIRQITEFVSQEEYKNLVPMFGIVNEALMGDIGIDQLSRL